MACVQRLFLPIVLAVLAALAAGCSASRLTRPEPADRWDPSADPRPEPVPFAVVVYQRVDLLTVAIGSGSIVHSSAEHGTIVLTAFHCNAEPGETPGVWIYTGRGLESIEADVIYPAQETLKEPVASLMALVDDFALLRLRDPRLFSTVPLEPADLGEIPDGADVELTAIAPEGWPHRHHFRWSILPDAVFQKGHSGSPLLVNGRLVGILVRVVRNTRIPLLNPTIGSMREELRKAGLEWALQSR